MSYGLSRNLINATVQNRSRHKDYYRNKKNISVPLSLKGRAARQVDNGALKLLLLIIEQSAIPVLVTTRSQGAPTPLQDNHQLVLNWKNQLGSSWVITQPSVCGAGQALELFDDNGSLLGKLSGDYNNEICWSQLLNALPTEGEFF